MISICFEAPNTTELNALIAAHLDSYAGTPQAPVAVPAPEETPKPKAKKAKAAESEPAPAPAPEAVEPAPALAPAAPAAPVTTATASVTLEDVRKSLAALALVADMPKVAEVLAKFNARKISELVDSNFHAVKSTADALTAELKKAAT